MDNNNLYQGLIPKKIQNIGKLIRIKDHQTVIKQRHTTPPNVTKASDI